MINFITTSTIAVLGDFLVLGVAIRSNALQITWIFDTNMLVLLYEKMIKTWGKSGHQEIPFISLLADFRIFHGCNFLTFSGPWIILFFKFVKSNEFGNYVIKSNSNLVPDILAKKFG